MLLYTTNFGSKIDQSFLIVCNIVALWRGVWHVVGSLKDGLKFKRLMEVCLRHLPEQMAVFGRDYQNYGANIC